MIPNSLETNGNSASTDRGSELARRIWHRYGSSPGVIETADVSDKFQRLARFSANRLPLLGDIQRRWTVSERTSPRVLPWLSYSTQPISIHGALTSDETQSPAPVDVNPAPASDSIISARQVSTGPSETPSVSERVALVRVSRRVSSPTSQPSARGEQTAAVIVRRHLDSPLSRVIQRQTLSGEDLAASLVAETAATQVVGSTIIKEPNQSVFSSPLPILRSGVTAVPSLSETAVRLPSPLPLLQPRASQSFVQRREEMTAAPLTPSATDSSARILARAIGAAAPPAQSVEGQSESVPPPMPNASAPAVDSEQLVEQVWRLIYRRLAIERERRGIGRWH